MAKVVTDNKHYRAIADAIRALIDTNRTYKPEEMAHAIIGYIAGGIDLTDVESYFIAEVVNAMKYVKRLGTDDWVHHIVITDTHLTKNYGHSEAIVAAMQDTGYFGKLIHLGDVVDAGSAEELEAMTDYFGEYNGNMLFAIGNHDVKADNWQSVFYNALLSNSSDLVVDQSSNYNYYWDDAEHRIRYIVYRYSNGKDYAIARLMDVPDGYHVVTLCHYPNILDDYIARPLLAKGLLYIGNVNGHLHEDAYQVGLNGMYNEVKLTNDGWINSKEEKVDGTVTSQALTVMSINTTEKRVQLYRIGQNLTLAKNWGYNYVQGGSVETWIPGLYWTTTGTATMSRTHLSTKKYDLIDENSELIAYYIKSLSGALRHLYNIEVDSNGNYLSRASISTDSGFNGFTPMKQVNANASDVLVSVEFADETTQPDTDITISTELTTIGRSVGLDGKLSADAYSTGYYISASGAMTQTTDNDVYTAAFDVTPNTQYTIAVDDSEWGGSNYFFAIAYTGQFSNYKFSGRARLGTNAAGTKQITITTGSNDRFVRLTIRGLGTVSNYADKVTITTIAT